MNFLVLALGSAALIAARWLPARARLSTLLGAAAVIAVRSTLSAAELRWQWWLVLAVDVVVLAVVAPGRWRAKRWLALSGSFTALAMVGMGGVAVWALPVPVLPPLSGEFPVGTRVAQWTDTERAEPATAEPGDRRTVVVQLWYPATRSEGGATAQYLGRTRKEAEIVADAAADYLGVPPVLLDGLPLAHSHATVDAPPVASRFPVVLFSPGLGGVRTQNTAWAEDLASRGYVVAGVDHPYDSAAVVLDGGRVVRTKVSADGNPDAWTATRAADLSFVLTRLGGLANTSPQVAVTGHSLGGAAAMRAAQLDPRFTAVIDLDGGLRPGTATGQAAGAGAVARTQGSGRPGVRRRRERRARAGHCHQLSGHGAGQRPSHVHRRPAVSAARAVRGGLAGPDPQRTDHDRHLRGVPRRDVAGTGRRRTRRS